jgi:hypothetical protein
MGQLLGSGEQGWLNDVEYAQQQQVFSMLIFTLKSFVLASTSTDLVLDGLLQQVDVFSTFLVELVTGFHCYSSRSSSSKSSEPVAGASLPGGTADINPATTDSIAGPAACGAGGGDLSHDGKGAAVAAGIAGIGEHGGGDGDGSSVDGSSTAGSHAWGWQRRLHCVLLARGLTAAAAAVPVTQLFRITADGIRKGSCSACHSEMGVGNNLGHGVCHSSGSSSSNDSSHADVHLDDLVKSTTVFLSVWSQSLHDIIEILKGAAAAGHVADVVMQQLLEESSALRKAILECPTLKVESADQEVPDQELPCHQDVEQLLARLQAFGAAVCAELPIQWTCNYHGCCNTNMLSELELVSGKQCVCGGCRVARYCSAQCQRAHWHQWHKTVCKRIKQQRQQQEQAAIL